MGRRTFNGFDMGEEPDGDRTINIGSGVYNESTSFDGDYVAGQSYGSDSYDFTSTDSGFTYNEKIEVEGSVIYGDKVEGCDFSSDWSSDWDWS